MTPIDNSTGASSIARVLAGPLFAAMLMACGSDTPTAPTATLLPDGNYALGITLGTLPPIGGSPTFCMQQPGGVLSATATLPVRVTRSGERWMIRMAESTGGGSGSLTMTLTASSPRAVSGTVAGNGRNSDESVSATIAALTTLSGTALDDTRLSGQIEGEVRLDTRQGAITCRSSSWTLAPR